MNLCAYFLQNREAIVAAILRHLELFGLAMSISIVLGLAISLAASARPRAKSARAILNCAAAFQAVPSIAVVALVFLVLGIGIKPAVAALSVYSLAPIIFNSVSGIASADRRAVEAAEAIGYTGAQILFKVKLPLAFPVIMGGIRSAATINIGTAAVASVIGGGGLGDFIFFGLRLRNDAAILIGAGLSALLAILIDAVLAAFEKALTSKGLSSQR